MHVKIRKRIENPTLYNAKINYSQSNIESISIRGNNKTESLAQTAIANISGFAHKCSFKDVSISQLYCGFDLQIFNSIFERCTVSYGMVGYFLHGRFIQGGDIVSVEGTTLTLISCLASDCFHEGIKLVGITYSTLINCGFDGCGIGSYDTPILPTSMRYTYYVKQCSGVSFVNCGLEMGARFLYLENCHQVIFSGGNFILPNNKFTSDYNYAQTIRIIASIGCRISDARFRFFSSPSPSSENMPRFVYMSLGNDAQITYFENIIGITISKMIYIDTYRPYNVNIKENVFDRGHCLLRPKIFGVYNKGYQYFDTTIGRPIIWNGNKWVDSMGGLIADPVPETVLHVENGAVTADNEQTDGNYYYPSEHITDIKEGDLFILEDTSYDTSSGASATFLIIAYGKGTYKGEGKILEISDDMDDLYVMARFNKAPVTGINYTLKKVSRDSYN